MYFCVSIFICVCANYLFMYDVLKQEFTLTSHAERNSIKTPASSKVSKGDTSNRSNKSFKQNSFLQQ